MIEWLLKEEEKAKVGRPKLASQRQKKISKIMLAICALILIILSFNVVNILKGRTFFEGLNSIPIKELKGLVNNSNGFLMDDNYSLSKYKMTFKTKNIKSYSGNYKYTLYKLKKGKYKEIESNIINNNKDSFDVIVDRIVNKNVTYKIKLEIINASKIKTSFAPKTFEFVNSKKNKYAYKIFTVKAKYSPISNTEYRESKKKNDMISIDIKEDDPRTFILDCKDLKCNINVSYTDMSSRKVVLKDDKNVTKKNSYQVPSINRISQVTFKISIDEGDISDYKLSNWKLIKKKDNKYITNTYYLKPESAY